MENTPPKSSDKQSEEEKVAPVRSSESTSRTSSSSGNKLAGTDRRAIRREQCRANQARYRQKQMRIKRQLQQELQRLEEEIHGLKLKKRSLRFERKTNQSPWTIVSEVFRLVEDGFRSPWRLANLDEMMKHEDTRRTLQFLQKAFVHDVAFGGLRGINALMDQWRRYSLYFEEPHLELKQVTVLTPSVLCASATLSLTITEFTLRCLFPHLLAGEKQAVNDDEDGMSLESRLLGQRLDCSCWIRFYFDEENGRVVRLEPALDLVVALLHSLNDCDQVCYALDQAFITLNGAIGDIPRHHSFGSD